MALLVEGHNDVAILALRTYGHISFYIEPSSLE